MSRKEFFKGIAKDFFIIATLVNVAIFVLGSVFNKDARFGYDAFLAPLIYAAFSMLPAGITYSRRELSIKEVLIRKAVQLILIEVILFLFCFGIDSLNKAEPLLLFGLGVSIAVIYVLVHLIDWFVASREAEKLTRDLKAFQSGSSN